MRMARGPYADPGPRTMALHGGDRDARERQVGQGMRSVGHLDFFRNAIGTGNGSEPLPDLGTGDVFDAASRVDVSTKRRDGSRSDDVAQCALCYAAGGGG